MRKHKTLFSDIPGSIREDIAVHHIEVKPDCVPKKLKPYRVPEKLREQIDQQFEDLLKMGKISENLHQNFAIQLCC